MTGRDFIIFMLCCLVWGGNFVITSWVVGENGVPPFLLAAARAVVVLSVMGVFLFRRPPAGFGRMLIVAVLIGPVHLALLYTGLQTAPASATSIISQTAIPIATVLSVIFLRERIGIVRSLAIAGAVIGVLVMVWEPGALRLEPSMAILLGAFTAIGVGTVLMRTVPEVDWRQYVAWTAVMMLLMSGSASLIFESGQIDIVRNAPVPLLAGALYAGLLITVFAHGQYFRLLQIYKVTQVVPLSIMTTVWACALGVVLLGETLYPRYWVGAALILPCVYIIARRGGQGNAMAAVGAED